MIEYPLNWNKVGQSIDPETVNNTLRRIIEEIGCNNLSFSGGIDSSLLLFHMSQIFDNVYLYTIGSNSLHPDIVYSKKIAGMFNNVSHYILIPSAEDIDKEKDLGEDYPGDAGVRIFYKWVSKHTDRIIAGDGIDEFMCGYYDHQNSPNEYTYYNYLRRLKAEQLNPLHKTSGPVKVNLPYIDDRIILLLSQIPLYDKVDPENRKKFMFRLISGKIDTNLFIRRKRGFVSATEPIMELQYA